MIGVFNRSHYEAVLVERVKELVAPEVWRPRYAHIRDFERALTDAGTTVVKLHLNVSYEEQGRRLQDRIDSPGRAVEVPARRSRRPQALAGVPRGVHGCAA